MRTIQLTASLLILPVALLLGADEKHKHDHKKAGHGAHVHDTAEVDIAVEGKGGEIEIRVPAMGVVGFEYVPKTPADKKKQADALKAVETNIASLIVLDAAAGCKLTPKGNVHVDQEEEDHAEVHGKFTVTCAKPWAGTKATFGFSKAYKAVAKVKVQAVGSSGSTGAEIVGDKGSVTLPR